MSRTNPLQNFFRKPKLSVLLPSRGRWYPKNTLTKPTVDIYPMTAADDLRFKTNEVLLNASAISELIQSCIPDIADPEQMPVLDLDVLILAIRQASYSSTIKASVSVPNTALTLTLDLDIQDLIQNFANAAELWDEKLTLINEQDESLTVILRPVTLKSMFSATRSLIRQQQATAEITMSSRQADEKIAELDNQMKSLSTVSINMVVDSISEILTQDGFSIKNAGEIRQFLNQLDLAYFKAIQKHIEEQKALISFKSIQITSTAEQIAAGAPETWAANIQFNINNFFES